MKFSVPGEVLRFSRELAGIKQGVLAKSLESNASFVSRLEKGGAVDPAFAERYLKSLKTEEAEDVLAYYNRNWSEQEPPSYMHPDREHIWTVEQTFQRLKNFEASSLNHPILSRTISDIREDLNDVLRYLERVDHVIAFFQSVPAEALYVRL